MGVTAVRLVPRVSRYWNQWCSAWIAGNRVPLEVNWDFGVPSGPAKSVHSRGPPSQSAAERTCSPTLVPSGVSACQKTRPCSHGSVIRCGREIIWPSAAYCGGSGCAAQAALRSRNCRELNRFGESKPICTTAIAAPRGARDSTVTLYQESLGAAKRKGVASTARPSRSNQRI
jgi:hypothetical protein